MTIHLIIFFFLNDIDSMKTYNDWIFQLINACLVSLSTYHKPYKEWATNKEIMDPP